MFPCCCRRRTSKIQKIKKQHFWLFSDSYERSRRAVRGKKIVQTSRVLFVKNKKMPNVDKINILWARAHGPNLGPWPGPWAQSGPMGPAHGPWPKGPMGPGPKWAHFHYFLSFVGSIFRYFGLNLKMCRGTPPYRILPLRAQNRHRHI